MRTLCCRYHIKSVKCRKIYHTPINVKYLYHKVANYHKLKCWDNIAFPAICTCICIVYIIKGDRGVYGTLQSYNLMKNTHIYIISSLIELKGTPQQSPEIFITYITYKHIKYNTICSWCVLIYTDVWQTQWLLITMLMKGCHNIIIVMKMVM